MQLHYIEKTHLKLAIGNAREDQITFLQAVKDSMIHATFLLTEEEGIEKGNPSFKIWQSIYLEADYLLSQILQNSAPEVP